MAKQFKDKNRKKSYSDYDDLDYQQKSSRRSHRKSAREDYDDYYDDSDYTKATGEVRRITSSQSFANILSMYVGNPETDFDLHGRTGCPDLAATEFGVGRGDIFCRRGRIGNVVVVHSLEGLARWRQ